LRGAAFLFVVVAFFFVLAATDFVAFLAAVFFAFAGAAAFLALAVLLVAFLVFFAFLGGTVAYLLPWTFGASTRAGCLELLGLWIESFPARKKEKFDTTLDSIAKGTQASPSKAA